MERNINKLEQYQRVELLAENGQVLFSKVRKTINGKRFNDIIDVWLFESEGNLNLSNATTDEVEAVA